MHYFTGLRCRMCGTGFPAEALFVCDQCLGPLEVTYDYEAIGRAVTRDQVSARPENLWRYRELLPLADDRHRISLGEGWSPLIPCSRLGPEIGIPRLTIKDEGQLPTGSFKARGMAVAVSMALELGAVHLAAPSAGNAGGALAQYGARAGLPCTIFMPADVPAINRIECQEAGARTYLVEGLINDCGRLIREGASQCGWFDLSTLKEPYRVEGKKTMGYELAEQLGWRLPDVILYPTGGGTGLVGMWKAFEEMETLGWIDGRRPKMVAVQSEGCAPIARAFHAGDEFAEPWQDAETCAAGIRVPAAVGDFLMLRALRESGGTAVTVSDRELLDACRLATSREGLFICPEGGAALAGMMKLLRQGWLTGEEEVVLFNTGTGLKYGECFPVDLPLLDPSRPIDYASL